MFYTPPLFKVSNAFSPKNPKNKKKSPGCLLTLPFRWVRGFPTSSAPPKMMNWRLLYDSSWPWAHQQPSQWSLEAAFGLKSHFWWMKNQWKSMGLPQRHQKTFFFWGGVPQNLGVNQSVNVHSSASRFWRTKTLRNDFWEKDGRKTNIQTFYHWVNSTAGRKHPPTKVGKPSSPSPLDSSCKTMKSHCSINVSCGSLRPVLGRLPIALREASSWQQKGHYKNDVKSIRNMVEYSCFLIDVLSYCIFEVGLVLLICLLTFLCVSW